MIWRILVISISVGALVYVAFDTYARHKLIKNIVLRVNSVDYRLGELIKRGKVKQ